MRKTLTQTVIYFEVPQLLSATFKDFGLILPSDINGYTRQEFLAIISGHSVYTRHYLLSRAMEIGILSGEAGRNFWREVTFSQTII